MVVSSSSSKWYVVHCHSGFEKKIADAIMDEATKDGIEKSFKMKSKRGELKSRKCGPDCSEKQYSEIRQVTAPARSPAIGSPWTPPPCNRLRMVMQRPSPEGALPVIRQGPIRRNQT